MHRRSASALSMIVTVVAGLTPVSASAAEPAATTNTRAAEIAAHDGTKLRAAVCEPTSPGPHPVAVLVAAWGGGSTQNIIPCEKLASKGYTTVSYGPRGFGESEGQVQVGSKQDADDVSSVIDWTLSHTAADLSRIGVGGISYGAGISLMASAFDPRIRAVASMSGWADLVSSLYGDRTRHAAVGTILRISGEKDGHLSDETRSMLDKYMREADSQQVIDWARARSPTSYVASINRNQPATLMIQAWNETVFPPDQMGRFNDRLTGPHQLEVVPGEHAAAETSGLLGLPNQSWEHVYRWFDEHLRGLGDPAHEPPVVVKPRGGTDRPRESYPDWEHVTDRAERFTMAPGGNLRAGEAGGSPQPTTIESGVDTVADGGIPLVTYTAEALSGHPPAIFLPAVDRKHGAVWTSDPLPENRRLRGGPHLHTTIKPSTANGMLVSYLYDVDRSGQAKLITHVPYTWKGATPNTPLTVDTVLPATAYDVPAGHRLGLVIDTADPLYFLNDNKFGAPLELDAAPGAPSWISLALSEEAL